MAFVVLSEVCFLSSSKKSVGNLRSLSLIECVVFECNNDYVFVEFDSI